MHAIDLGSRLAERRPDALAIWFRKGWLPAAIGAGREGPLSGAYRLSIGPILKGRLRVDLTRSPSRPAMAGLCAFRPLPRAPASQ